MRTAANRGANRNRGALFQWNDHGRVSLDSLSTDRRGDFIFVFVHGRLITQLPVDHRFSDAQIYIASGLTTNEIELKKRKWPALERRKQ